MKKTLFITAVIAAFCLLFAGCSDSSDYDDSSAQGTPPEKGDNEENDSGTEKIPNYLIVDGDKVLGYEGEAPAEIEIPEGTTVIGDYAFQNCKTIKSIKIPHTVKSIGEQAFWGCSYLTNIHYDAVEAYWKYYVELGDHAIPTATKINCIVPSEFTIKNDRVWMIEITKYNSKLTEENVLIPNGIRTIGDEVFRGNKNIKSITLPDTLASIGASSFQYCTSLKNIELPKSLEDIDRNAFSGCTALEKITIPKSVKSMSQDVFDGCPSLKIFYESTVEDFEKIDFRRTSSNSTSNGSMSTSIGGATIHCTDGTIN